MCQRPFVYTSRMVSAYLDSVHAERDGGTGALDTLVVTGHSTGEISNRHIKPSTHIYSRKLEGV